MPGPTRWGTLQWLLAYSAGMYGLLFWTLASGFTLAERSLDGLMVAAFVTLMFGTIGMVVWLVLPVPLVCFLLRRWPRFRSGLLGTVWVVLAVTWAVGIVRPNIQRKFEVITGMDWELAPCVADFHGFGLADRRHLWVFRGTPEALDRQIAALPWTKEESVLIWKDQGKWIGYRRAREVFGSEPWEPQEHYRFHNDRFDDDATLPHGDAHLLADAKRERWIIWWDGM